MVEDLQNPWLKWKTPSDILQLNLLLPNLWFMRLYVWNNGLPNSSDPIQIKVNPKTTVLVMLKMNFPNNLEFQNVMKTIHSQYTPYSWEKVKINLEHGIKVLRKQKPLTSFTVTRCAFTYETDNLLLNVNFIRQVHHL